MKGSSSPHFFPYIRPTEKEKDFSPYITRIIPRKNGFSFDYFDKGCPDKPHKIFVRENKTEDDFVAFDIPYASGTVEGLKEFCDYEFYVKSQDGASSCQRIVRTGKDLEDAVVVDYLHPDDLAYEYSGRSLCAPSLVRLPSGDLFAAVGIFVDRNEFPALPCLSKTFRSKDEGETWQYEGDLLHTFNGSLFVHKEKLYFLSLRSDYDDLIISCSEDEGKTWSAPVILLPGESPHRWGWHSSCMAPISIGSKLFKAIEYGHVEIYSQPRTGKECSLGGKFYDLNHYIGVLSVDSDADLMKPESWTMSELYLPDADPHQCIEGNIIDGPDGVRNLLRTMKVELSLMMDVDIENPEKPMTNPKEIRNYPLSAVSKFEIKKDPVTNKYIAIGNHFPYSRRMLVMAVSDDLKEWRIAHVIKGDPTSDDAFSYVDYIFSGNDILLLSRSGFNGSVNQHDTNMISFHKVSDFRQYL